MPDTDNYAGERSFDARGSGQHKSARNKRGQITFEKNERDESSVNARRETQKDSQEVRSDKQGSRTARGPDDWGGYKGY